MTVRVTTFRASADGIPIIDKAPAANLDYVEDWSEWLQPNETITSSIVSVEPGLTKGVTVPAPTTITQWLSGGTVGTSYIAAVTITTSGARTDTRSFRINVIPR